MGSITRNIRYYGLIQIPDEAKKSRRFNVTFDIIRPAQSQYLNAKYNPSQTLHGYAMFLSDIRVIRSKPIQWDNVVIDEFRNDTLFLHQSISCSLNAVLTSFVNLEVALTLVPFEKINPIEKWKNLFPEYDAIAVKLLTETMVGQLTLTWDDLEMCSVPDSKPPEHQAPPDPPPPPQLPPTSPDDSLPAIAPPYDGGNDGGFTYKPGGNDDNNPPQEGDMCQLIRVTFTADYYNSQTEFAPITQTVTVFGESGRPYVDASIPGLNPTQQIYIKCRGVVELGQQCGELQVVPLTNFATPGGIKNLVIDEFTPM